MKRGLFVSIVLLNFLAIPAAAQAQLIRRPFLNRVITSPFVHDVVNYGITHYLPGFPTLPATTPTTPTTADSTIYVDSSVKGTLDRTATNLAEAKTIMDQLMVKNKDAIEKKDPAPKDPAPKVPATKVPATKVPAKSEAIPAPADANAVKRDALINKLMTAGHDALAKNNLVGAVQAFRDAHNQDPSNPNVLNLLLHADSQQRATQQNKDLVDAPIKAIKSNNPPIAIPKPMPPVPQPIVPPKKTDKGENTSNLTLATSDAAEIVIEGPQPAVTRPVATKLKTMPYAK